MTAPLELPDALISEHMPDDDIVFGYVTRGTMARYVEGVAAVNPDFREELEACIEGLEEAGETISAAARAWRMPAAVVVPFTPRTKARSGRLRYLAPFAAAAVVFAVAGGAYMKKEQEAARTQAQKDQEIAAKKEQIDKLMVDLNTQQEVMQVAQAELTKAQNEADRSAARSKLVAAQEQQRKTQANIQSVKAAGGPAKTGTAKAACNCQPGDPLCSCL